LIASVVPCPKYLQVLLEHSQHLGDHARQRTGGLVDRGAIAGRKRPCEQRLILVRYMRPSCLWARWPTFGLSSATNINCSGDPVPLQPAPR
jgi:hypothetical protein